MKLRLAAAAVSAVALIGLSACSDATPAPTVTVTVTPPANDAQPDPAGETTSPNDVEQSTPADPGGETTDLPSLPSGTETSDDGTITFEGDVQTETISVGPQNVEVPLGIKLPDNTTVSDAQQTVVMMIDQDPTAVIESVTASAAEAGYETYAQPDEYTWVFVGNGNAVLFQAYPQGQILTWGPEAMKDVLAEPQG